MNCTSASTRVSTRQTWASAPRHQTRKPNVQAPSVRQQPPSWRRSPDLPCRHLGRLASRRLSVFDGFFDRLRRWGARFPLGLPAAEPLPGRPWSGDPRTPGDGRIPRRARSLRGCLRARRGARGLPSRRICTGNKNDAGHAGVARDARRAGGSLRADWVVLSDRLRNARRGIDRHMPTRQDLAITERCPHPIETHRDPQTVVELPAAPAGTGIIAANLRLPPPRVAAALAPGSPPASLASPFSACYAACQRLAAESHLSAWQFEGRTEFAPLQRLNQSTVHIQASAKQQGRLCPSALSLSDCVR